MEHQLVEIEEFNLISKLSLIKSLDKVHFHGFCVINESVLIESDVKLKPSYNRSQGNRLIYTISFGYMCYLDRGCIITPPIIGYELIANNVTKKRVPLCSPMKFQSYIYIGKSSLINCIEIGSYVLIYNNVTLGRGSKIGNCVVIDEQVTIPDKTIIPSYSFVFKTLKKAGEGFKIVTLPIGIKK
ncbi:hypothetical protein Kpol_76p1 [Vanderwaltozyma polyspora DSM 70294]|uniref:Dynactin subunit 5 n=1 Tax=Vanderwaltozyma polyspora (strain ATCC 22028 / DSM 70294 / BCRC 21397 / CBS 2163 / NBRC 10782 / NRRL Y-8283 / UCD 57-17) TaxID=436907 RepID=A7TTW8_VANPO|nr:uncharacterized protein Kpol_76p1 [Vanderwaltozyma polyspora DSM 70294]EDO14288.1 hypothetical protein Kpol_76p1 [Vanderwaltozyma polyspora DSM 70294]